MADLRFDQVPRLATPETSSNLPGWLVLFEPGEALDRLCALWIGDAPRFGAVAAHFPESLWKRRFVASFWAPEVFFPWPFDQPEGGWYAWPSGTPSGGTRTGLDFCVMSSIIASPGQRFGFWSPELPEVRVTVHRQAGFVDTVAWFQSDRFPFGGCLTLRTLALLCGIFLLCLALPGVA